VSVIALSRLVRITLLLGSVGIMESISGQSSDSRPRRIDSATAELLLKTALEGRKRGTTGLPGFHVELMQASLDRRFYMFEVTWANPVGSIMLGHYAIDPETADVWDSIVCYEFRSSALRALQRRVRIKCGITHEVYLKFRKKGPMCD
jgi:hypothetical protein